MRPVASPKKWPRPRSASKAYAFAGPLVHQCLRQKDRRAIIGGRRGAIDHDANDGPTQLGRTEQRAERGKRLLRSFEIGAEFGNGQRRDAVAAARNHGIDGDMGKGKIVLRSRGHIYAIM